MPKYSFGVVAALMALAGCSNTDTDTRSTTSEPSSTASAGLMENAQHKDHEGHEEHGMAMGQGMNHAMGTSGLESLRTLSGKEFDIAFLSQMIAHHEAAVVMAEQALKTAKDAGTRQDAQNVIKAQTAEIKQMTDWLRQWYDTDPSKEQQALVNTDMRSMMAMPVASEKMFYEMMVPHHQGAIDMSELAADKANRPEVKTLAAQIIRDQKAEIGSYQKKLQQGQQ